MYLKTDRIIVTLKGINFRSYRLGGTGEYVLDPTALTGWDDGVNVRRNATVRPVSNGDFKEPYTFSSRLIGISGTAIAASRGELQRMRDALAGILADGEYADISVETSDSTRYAVVGLEKSLEWTQQHDRVAVFRLELYAPDPHIYGSERTVTLGATNDVGGGLIYPISYPISYNPQGLLEFSPALRNTGNAFAWPKFKVTGDYYSGFTLTDGGDNKVTYSGMVSSAAPVEIDMGRGTAIQNGTDKTVLISERDWFGIPPGETIKPQFNPLQSGVGWCDIIIRDTFI
jgi:hypothetical protein